ncbi:MAG TPA: exo-alpha-sialidase [Acidimicrobiia bacterium]|jgi:photosystem II stability/assembly factor-like uncharacterized protein|nr:exo-alpha-sialidase [Acidimicrobiia bacterium]
MSVALAIGTLKGAWVARSDDGRTWSVDGPYLKGWQVNTFGVAPDGTYLLSTGSTWYGAALHRSSDLANWSQVVAGPAYEEDSGRKLEQIWTLAMAGRSLFAGVAQAGLFRSEDAGETWAPVEGFNDHPTRPGWQAGLGGLVAHRILVDAADPERMWVGASAVGVFATEDGGESWELRNDGVTRAAPDDDYPDIGFCVHGLVHDPDEADSIWRQDHTGVYRSRDGARTWQRIETGLPAGFGFPVGRDPQTGRLFVVPLESDEFRLPVNGEFAVYASDDAGDRWFRAGDWSRPGFDGVLRDAMAIDGNGGVYVGSTAGRVALSADTGETWLELDVTFPRIVSLHAFVI